MTDFTFKDDDSDDDMLCQYALILIIYYYYEEEMMNSYTKNLIKKNNYQYLQLIERYRRIVVDSPNRFTE